MTQSPTPPGWYADPQNPGQQRYWDGSNWTDHRAPGGATAQASAPQAKKPWYFRWYSIVAGLVILLIIIASIGGGGGSDNAPTADTSSDAQTSSSSSAKAPPSKAAEKKPTKKKSGLDPDSDTENVVKVGKGYRLGDFQILSGWKVKNIGSGLGYEVDGLRVKNTTKSSHTFSVNIKLYQGKNNVTADIQCIASEAKPGNVVEVDCLPDGSGKPYNRVTISNSF